jgi:hypothetical protein
MEIIKKGQPKNEKTYHATCRDCGTRIKFQRKEAKETFDQRDGNYLTVKCPVCVENIHTGI